MENLLKFYDHELLNEEMSTISSKKLRDSLHDIVSELKPKKTIDVEELSEILLSDYKINISPYFLDKFLDEYMKMRKGEKSNTFFKKEDTKWLGVREIAGGKEIRNNLNYLKPSLAKHKRRLFQEDEKNKLEIAYKSGMKDLDFSEDVIKKSLVLQSDEDSKEIIKYIYNDVIVLKKYKNNYDNCWKLMMLIAKNNNLDRVRGWFSLAPDSVKEEYRKGNVGEKRINLELTKYEESKKKPPVPYPTNTPSNVDYGKKESVIAENNFREVSMILLKKKMVNFNDLIDKSDLKFIDFIIKGIKLYSITYDEFKDYYRKAKNLMSILMRYYNVDKNRVIDFYGRIGLNDYIDTWEMVGKKPKI